MKRLASTLPNMIISLGIVTIVAGALLGFMYSITEKPIAEQQEKNKQEAIKMVAPPYDNNPEAEKWETTVDGATFTVYPAEMKGKLVGAAVKGSSMSGFAGLVEVMAGFDADGTVRDYRVLSQAETPGLGAKMEAWFRDPTGARSVLGKNPGDYSFYVTKDKDKHGQVDAITAATISSRAFLEIMRNAYDSYVKYRDQQGSDKMKKK